MRDVENGDGSSFTAAFSERLAGDREPSHPAPWNYQLVTDPLSAAAGCPASTDPSAWRGDAGSSWRSSEYRATLYNHALPPGGQPSCIAADGQAAFIGASSGHPRGVHVLLLDGSVPLIRASIDLRVWRAFATLGPSNAGAADSP